MDNIYQNKLFDRNKNDIQSAFFSKWVICILYIINAVILEITMFVIMHLGVVPNYFALDFAIIFIFAAVLFVIPSFKLQKIMFAVFVFVQMLLVLANCSLYKYHGDIFSLGILGFAKEGAAVLHAYMLEFRVLPVYIMIVLSDILVMKIVGGVCPRKFPVTQKTVAGLLALFVGFSFFGAGIFNIEKTKFKKDANDRYLYDTLMFKNAAMSKFGSFAYYFREITGKSVNLLSPDKSEAEVLAYLNNFTPVDNSDNPYLADVGAGVLKNDNVLSILMESLEWFVINEHLTPTLYRLHNGYNFSLDSMGREIGWGKADGSDKRGLVFSNYYSKSKTDFSEASAILGSYPYYDAYSSVVMSNPSSSVVNKNFGFSMPNMLKAHTDIEEARYMHTYLKSFYGRPVSFPAYGFDKLMFIEDMNVDYNIAIGNPILDGDAIDLIDDYIMPLDKKFFTQYSVISTHGPYTYYPGLNKYYAEIDKAAARGQLTNELINDPAAISFLAKTMDLDKCLQKIIVYLQNSGMIDNTTILMYSDHQAYYHAMDMKYKKQVCGYESGFDPERYRIPAAIYSTKLPYIDVDRFSTYFDFAPTLFDLMGVPYNPNIYLGHSAFSKEQSVCMVSRTGGVFNDRIFTMDGRIEKFSKKDVTPNELKEFTDSVEKFIDKWDYVDYMYYYNLYAKVDNYQPLKR